MSLIPQTLPRTPPPGECRLELRLFSVSAPQGTARRSKGRGARSGRFANAPLPVPRGTRSAASQGICALSTARNKPFPFPWGKTKGEGQVAEVSAS